VHPKVHDVGAHGFSLVVTDDRVVFRGTRCGMLLVLVNVLAEYPAEHDSVEDYALRHKAYPLRNL
jgi:hypothetical protein